MEWHDCKTDPPNELNHYIVKYCNDQWEEAWYCVTNNSWRNVFDEYIFPDKWAEVNLDEEN